MAETQTDDLLARARRVADVVPCGERAELIGRLCDRLEEVTGQRDEVTACLMNIGRNRHHMPEEIAAEVIRGAMASNRHETAEIARLAALVFGEGSP